MKLHETTSKKLKEIELYMGKINKDEMKLDEIFEIGSDIGDHISLDYVNMIEVGPSSYHNVQKLQML